MRAPETRNLAWLVEIHSLACVCFAPTKAKAQYIAVRSYWEAFQQRRGEWPRAKAARAPVYDNSPLANDNRSRQRAWGEDYVRGY